MTLFDLVWHVALLTLRNFSLLILFLQLFAFYLASLLPFAAQIFVLLSLWLFPLLHSLISLIVVVQSLVQFSSVTQSCPTLCNPMNCSTPGLSVHHKLLEFTQTHVHRVGDAI